MEVKCSINYDIDIEILIPDLICAAVRPFLRSLKDLMFFSFLPDFILCKVCNVCVFAPVRGCVEALELICGGEEGMGTRLIPGVWASGSGRLITAPAPAARPPLPRPACLGASSLPESDASFPVVSRALVSGGAPQQHKARRQRLISRLK